MTLDKQIAAGNPCAAANDTISHDYLVTNTGNASLAGPVCVTEQDDGGLSCSHHDRESECHAESV